jgi:predicted PurR-regulated permease PerM
MNASERHGGGGEVRVNVAYRVVLLAAALIVFGLVFQELFTLLLAVLMTVIVAMPLAACASWFERHGVPRALGAVIALLTALLVFAGILSLVIPAFVDEAERFAEDAPEIADDLRERIRDLTGAESREITDQARDFVQRYTDDPGQIVERVTAIGATVAGLLGAGILMLITALYMAIKPQPLIRGMLRMFPPARRDRALYVMERLRSAWIGWLQGVAADGVVTGTLLYIGLTVLGLDFALVFSVLSALLVVVPYFGAIAGGIPPVLLALTDSPGKALLVLGVYLLVQQLESNLIIPLVMSRAVRLHPAVIAIGVVVVGQLFGLAGLFVAVPLISLFVILVEELWVIPMEEAEARRLGMPAPHGLPEHELAERPRAARMQHQHGGEH